jgi:hypothetical protein
MIKTRQLTSDGLAAFSKWLENPVGETPPAELLDDEVMSEPFGDYEIDETCVFGTRFEFGKYLNEQLSGADFNGLMSPDCDGLWGWLAIVYFEQLAGNGIRRAEHYIVMRKGTAGSLAYRQAARTSFELVYIHGECAQICLKSPIHTFGDMTKQLASRQAIAHNRGFFQTAFDLYLKDEN